MRHSNMHTTFEGDIVSGYHEDLGSTPSEDVITFVSNIERIYSA